MLKRLLIGLSALCITILVAFSAQLPRSCGKNSGTSQFIPPESPLLPGRRISYECQGKIEKVTGIILHYTDTDSFEEALAYMEAHDHFVQIMVDRDGKTYQLTDHLDDFSAGARGANGWAINIEIVGKEKDLDQSARTNDEQFQSVKRLIYYLSQTYDVPLTNKINDPKALLWRGIFSHQQIDQLHPRGGRKSELRPA